MDKLKMILKDNTFIRHTFFIVFNAILLYILYFLIKNIGSITGGLHHGFLVLMDAFKPLLIGLVLAYLLNPLVSFVDGKLLKLLVRLPDDPIKLEKKKNTRYLISVLISYLFVIAAILGDPVRICRDADRTHFLYQRAQHASGPDGNSY